MEENFGQQNAPVTPSRQKPIKIIFLVCLLIIVIAIAGWYFLSPHQPANVFVNAPKVTNSVSNVKLSTSTQVTNLKNYTASTLPPQFPSDFTNPAKPDSVLSNFSMTLQSAVPTQMSIFKFTTTDTANNLLKLYQDYFAKNGWSANVKQVNNGVWMYGIKDKNFAQVTIIRPTTATTTTVTLQISSPL